MGGGGVIRKKERGEVVGFVCWMGLGEEVEVEGVGEGNSVGRGIEWYYRELEFVYGLGDGERRGYGGGRGGRV